jgi:hypothetical protein
VLVLHSADEPPPQRKVSRGTFKVPAAGLPEIGVPAESLAVRPHRRQAVEVKHPGDDPGQLLEAGLILAEPDRVRRFDLDRYGIERRFRPCVVSPPHHLRGLTWHRAAGIDDVCGGSVRRMHEIGDYARIRLLLSRLVDVPDSPSVNYHQLYRVAVP